MARRLQLIPQHLAAHLVVRRVAPRHDRTAYMDAQRVRIHLGCLVRIETTDKQRCTSSRRPTVHVRVRVLVREPRPGWATRTERLSRGCGRANLARLLSDL